MSAATPAARGRPASVVSSSAQIGPTRRWKSPGPATTFSTMASALPVVSSRMGKAVSRAYPASGRHTRSCGFVTWQRARFSKPPLAVASVLLLPVMGVEAVADEYVHADCLFGAAAWWLRSSPFVPALLALGFATGFIHYLLDRAAFRFSCPDVSQAAAGLLRPRPRGADTEPSPSCARPMRLSGRERRRRCGWSLPGFPP